MKNKLIECGSYLDHLTNVLGCYIEWYGGNELRVIDERYKYEYTIIFNLVEMTYNIIDQYSENSANHIINIMNVELGEFKNVKEKLIK